MDPLQTAEDSYKINQDPKVRWSQSLCSQRWLPRLQVVGGAEHGGIIVRTGCELTSEMAASRLSTGSVVKDPGHPRMKHRRHGRFGTIPGVMWVKQS